MKKLVVLGMGVCLVLAFASCKSSESAYKKAYEKAKQQELAEPQVEAPVEVTPVVAAPVTTTKVADTSGVRQEKVSQVWNFPLWMNRMQVLILWIFMPDNTWTACLHRMELMEDTFA